MAFPLAALAGAASTLGGGETKAALTGLSTVVTSLTGKFQELINPIARLVSAVDPAIVDQLNRAFKELDAVVGQAFRPVIVAAIEVVRSFAGNIFSTMQQLQPIIAKVANTMSGALQNAFANLGTLLEGLLPVFDVMADILSGLIAIWGDLIAAVRPVISVVLELAKQLIGSIFGQDVGGQVKDFMQQIRDAVQMFVKNMVLAVASFLKLIGATNTLNALIKGLQPREVKDVRGFGVAENPAFRAIADLGKDMQLAAFRASAMGGVAGPRKVEDIMGDMLGEVQKIANGDMASIPAQIQSVVDAFVGVYKGLKDIWDKLPNSDLIMGREEEKIDAEAARLKQQGRLKEYKGGKNDGFWKTIFDT